MGAACGPASNGANNPASRKARLQIELIILPAQRRKGTTADKCSRQRPETRYSPPDSCCGEPLSSLYDARGREKNVVAAGVCACNMLPSFGGPTGESRSE